MSRTSSITRKTNETDINLTLNLDGEGLTRISTGIGFFDHMLESFARHGFVDLELSSNGDLQVDGHHTVEDTGIALGMALKEALGDKAGIRRFGHFILPMDDALALCAIDLGGRPYLSFEADFPCETAGGLETGLVREFFYALVTNADFNLHIKLLDGHDTHHMIEAIFKAFAKALSEAVRVDDRVKGVLSTKGVL